MHREKACFTPVITRPKIFKTISDHNAFFLNVQTLSSGHGHMKVRYCRDWSIMMGGGGGEGGG